MYLAFIGPYNEPGSYPWNLDGASAMRKFLDRVYTLRSFVTDSEQTPEEEQMLAKAIAKTTDDTERFKFNTAISALMVLVRDIESAKTVSKETFKSLTSLLAPYAPHLAEHLWKEVGGEGSVHTAAWPEAVEVVVDQVVMGVQINGKTRGEITISPEASEEEAVTTARNVDAIAKILHEAEITKVIYKPGRILNLVIT